uniref:Uncharacterized protein n=1 Tax=Anguilla anguilla TaxID=7936 RepID=A0A0E9TCQ5_ANGAN
MRILNTELRIASICRGPGCGPRSRTYQFHKNDILIHQLGVDFGDECWNIREAWPSAQYKGRLNFHFY